jgi:hypothetical protein
MLCCIKDCIDPATSNIIHHHHHEYDKKCDADGEDKNYCVLTICQRHKVQLTDKLGNEVEYSFTDPEIFYKPLTKYKMKDKDPKDSSKGKERQCVIAGINETMPEYREYTLPFNSKNFEQLFKQRPAQSPASVSLSIYEEGSSEGPRQITNTEKFKNIPFDYLWTEAITPRFKFDRNYGDNLQDSHIK